MKKKEQIVAGLILCALSTHVYAYIYWDQWKLLNIFYVSLYAVVYVLSVAVALLAMQRILKFASTLSMTASGYLFYLEFAGDPQNWSTMQMWIGAFVLLNGLMISLINEKLKP